MKRLSEKKPEKKRKKYGHIRTGILSAIFVLSGTCFSYADTDPVAGINNLKTLIASIVSAVGGIILLWSAVQLGIAVKKHDPAATSEAFLGVAAGLIIACAPWVVNYIIGGGN